MIKYLNLLFLYLPLKGPPNSSTSTTFIFMLEVDSASPRITYAGKLVSKRNLETKNIGTFCSSIWITESQALAWNVFNQIDRYTLLSNISYE